ncbi:AraC family transcriptional regulator [Cohnella fermenti]|uniref:Helix-turn-helix domain-containing protein n=1 Tax=Cohnella fermenti TaxID=2565925 RepID=A0A4S4C5Z9_9BACL|nr:AraC family transcriptional regulator [Cohnella fermenti]THF83270.1 helix-turn-helix domain-containing protein [Cohnella fermenti]
MRRSWIGRLRTAAGANRLIPKQTYIRIFLGIGLLFALVSVPFAFLLSSQFSRYAIHQIDQVSEAEMAHSRDNAQFLLSKMISYGLNMYANKSIRAWVMADAESQEAQVDALAAGTQYMATESFLENVYMINMRTEHVIDLRYGISSFGQFRDQGMLEQARHPQPSYQRFIPHELGGRTKLALVIPTVPSGQPSFGYLVLILNDDLLKQYLLKNNGKAGVQSFILNDEGQAMLGSADESLEPLYGGFAARAAAEQGSFTYRYDSETWSVQYAKIEPQGWTFYQMAKLSGIRADFQSFRTKMLAFLAGLIVLLLAILFWNSRRTYRPFSQLASQLETRFGSALREKPGKGAGASVPEEYRVIRYGIEMLEDRMDRLDSSMREHRNVIKAEYLRQWILQGKLIAPVETYLREEMPALFEADGLCVGVVRISGYSAFKEQYSFASRKLVKYAMGNIAEEVVRREGFAEAVDLGGDHLVLLIAGGELDGDRLPRLLEEAGEQIRQWTQVRVALSVSGRKSIADDLRAVYQHIHELTMLQFVSGESKVFLERDFEAYMRKVEPLPDDGLLDELIAKVRMGRTEELAAGLDRIFEPMQSMLYTQSKFQLSHMLYTLFKAFNKLPSVESVEGIDGLLESFDTLAGVRSWLEAELLAIVEELSNRRGSSRRDEVVTEIVDYVRGHLHDPMLTVEEIAEHVSLSSRHARQLFKDVWDMTLSDYILQERVEKVKELLGTTEWTVTDIGERAGFQTKSHFFTVFKKATGMTPSQYREAL